MKHEEQLLLSAWIKKWKGDNNGINFITTRDENEEQLMLSAWSKKWKGITAGINFITIVPAHFDVETF